MKRFLALALAFSATSVVARPVASQVGPEVRRAVGTLGDSAHVQIMAPGVFVEDGYFLGMHLDSLRVVSADAVFAVGLDELEGLSVEGSRWKSGGIQGGIIGLVAGGAAGFFLGYGRCGNQFQGCDEHAWRVSLRWGLVFGVGGAVVGSVVGSRLRQWRSVFP